MKPRPSARLATALLALGLALLTITAIYGYATTPARDAELKETNSYE